MPSTGISDINDYSSLYSAYSRLKNEGDRTTSAKNAKAIFGQNVDIDGDNTAELWELMQMANDAHNRIVFNEIEPLKAVQNNKYPQISDDNPIDIILSIESEVTGEEKTAKAYAVINDIIRVAKEKITDEMGPAEKLRKLYGIIREDFDIQPEEMGLLSEGLAGEKKAVDCDTGSYIYIAVAHELGWPVYLAATRDHAFNFWRFNEYEGLGFDTTNGQGVKPRFRRLLEREAESIVKGDMNYLFATAYDNRGVAYHKSGKLGLAINDYTKAITLMPDDLDAYNNRGIAYHALGENKLARQDFKTARRLRR